MNVSREDATSWASWFRAIGDPTRILILNLLATEARPMSVAEHGARIAGCVVVRASDSGALAGRS